MTVSIHPTPKPRIPARLIWPAVACAATVLAALLTILSLGDDAPGRVVPPGSAGERKGVTAPPPASPGMAASDPAGTDAPPDG